MRDEETNVRAVENFPGYFITDYGWVWSITPSKGCPEGRWLTQMVSRQGYLSVCLRRDKTTYKFLVHGLVLEAYVGPVPEGLVARHRSLNTLNNELSNLYYGKATDPYIAVPAT